LTGSNGSRNRLPSRTKIANKRLQQMAGHSGFPGFIASVTPALVELDPLVESRCGTVGRPCHNRVASRFHVLPVATTCELAIPTG
jgi:hypothetical protein